jgi:hypothetical protein
MITALGSLSGTSWGAIFVLGIAAAFVVGVFLTLKLATRDTTGMDAQDDAAQAEMNARYAPPLDLASACDVEPTPDDETEIPFEPLHDKGEAWARERLAAIAADLKLSRPAPEPDQPGWFPTPPEVLNALASGSGMTGFTRQAMRDLRMELGEEAIR